jgi:hypothetical protein
MQPSSPLKVGDAGAVSEELVLAIISPAKPA